MTELAQSVGVVVPVHGWSPYLAEALDAVVAEGPEDVVVVDDGSADPVVLHPDHAGRCRLVRREVAGGPGAARNAGVAALGTDLDLVAFCDADDAWEPGSLTLRVAAVATDSEAAGAFGRALIVGADGR
ncbi:MAG: glycosyl transferase family 2, partial [Solirubrobacteraceae bacterium]|nr:glycosyl transferase family 2 [Solirubrobacteraceae bacterium]